MVLVSYWPRLQFLCSESDGTVRLDSSSWQRAHGQDAKALPQTCPPPGLRSVHATQFSFPPLSSNSCFLLDPGLTETSPITHITPLDIPHSKDGSIGVLLSNVEARLIDDEGNEVPLGERGELWMRCTSVMKGYWRNPKATNESIDSEGWFKTGDVAIIDKDSYT